MRAPTSELPLLEMADQREWHEWLAANHADSSGVRLAVTKKNGNATSLTYEQATEEAVAFGWIDSTAGRLDADRFAIRYTPRRPGGNWSRSNKERVQRLTAQGRMQPAGLAAVEAAKRDGSWERLEQIEAMTVPPDLAEALRERPGAESFFASLAPSARQLALYAIASAKRPATRAARVAAVADAAAEGRRPIEG